MQTMCQYDLSNKILVVENCFLLSFQLLTLFLHVSVFIVIVIILSTVILIVR